MTVKRSVKTLGMYLVWRVWLICLAVLASTIIPFVPAFTPAMNYGIFLPKLAWIWGNFDGIIFMDIAARGYSQPQVPFFPLFPLTMRFLMLFHIPVVYAGLIISTVSFLGALYFVYRLLKLEKQAGLFWLFIVILFSFPTGYHFTAVYSDSLFFFLATATLYFSREKRFLIASAFGALATLCRLNGLALAGMMAVEYVFMHQTLAQSWNWRNWGTSLLAALHPKKIWKSGILWVVLIPLAFVAYLGFIELRFGDWHLFFSGVEVWHRNKLTFPLQTLWRYLKILFLTPNKSFTYWIAVGELIFTTLYGLVLLFSWKRIRPSYWAMMAGHWLIPVVTGTLQGMPRYGLHMFPLFFFLALSLEKKPMWVKMVWLSVSLVLQAVYLGFFTSGYFVS